MRPFWRARVLHIALCKGMRRGRFLDVVVEWCDDSAKELNAEVGEVIHVLDPNLLVNICRTLIIGYGLPPLFKTAISQ